jgi:hypothetical protein
LQEKKITSIFVPNLKENKLIDKLMKISVQDYNNTLALNKDKKYVTNEHTRYALSYAVHVIGELRRFDNTNTLAQNEIQTQITTTEEDPRQARMTNYGIPTCYRTTAETKIHDRDNYYILNDYIYPSLRSQLTPPEEDPRQARMTTRNIPVCDKNTEKTKITPVLTINKDTVPTSAIPRSTLGMTTTARQEMTNNRSNSLQKHVRSTQKRTFELLKTMRSKALQTHVRSHFNNKQHKKTQMDTITIKMMEIPTSEIPRSTLGMTASNQHASESMHSQQGMTASTAMQATHGRANYNIDRDNCIGDSSLYARNDGKQSTHIGDSSLYARNDDHSKATDYDGTHRQEQQHKAAQHSKQQHSKQHVDVLNYNNNKI